MLAPDQLLLIPSHDGIIFAYFRSWAKPRTCMATSTYACKMLKVITRHLEFIEELELFKGIELGDFSRTDFVEDDL